MKGNFYFQKFNGERVLLGESINEEKAMVLMHNFLSEHGFKSHYTRSWKEGKSTIYDIGSYVEFFIFMEADN